MVVGCFSLDLAHEDVSGVGELVLVERVVLDCRADTDDMMLGLRGKKDEGGLRPCLQPDVALLAFYVQATPCVYGEVRVRVIWKGGVEIVICSPEPYVFHIQSRCRACNVH